MKKFGKVYMGIVFALLYLPILVMIVYSFNAGKSTAVFTLSYGAKGSYDFGHWYAEIFANEDALSALGRSLILAVLSAAVSTVIGTAAAVGIAKLRNKYVKNVVMGVTNIPMMNPDIVTGISMMLLFATTFTVVNAGQAGFATILIAHITFNLPYVILSILPKYRQMDPHLPEAAMDLGCTEWQSFFKVELPFISPAIVSGAIMAFTLSLDDYVISLFTGGTYETLPLYIFGLARKKVAPTIYALSTLFLVLVLALLLLENKIEGHMEKKRAGKDYRIG